MKRFSLLLTILLVACGAFAQSSFSGGVYYAPNFGKWKAQIYTGFTGTSTQTFTALQSTVTTNDGIQFVPFVVNGKITVGTGATQETVTVTAVSGCLQNQTTSGVGTCNVTASFTNAHGASEPIGSGDNGIMEATVYAQNTGGGQVKFFVDCGVVTLATGGVTTTTTCFVPNLFFNSGSASRVTTTITTSTGWEVGIIGALATFSTNNTTLTAGTTAFTTQGTPAVALATSATSANLTAVLVTAAGGAAGAGAIHIRVWGTTPAQPAF